MPRFVRHVAEIETIEDAQRVFLDWTLDFEAVDDATALLSLLVSCDDVLPDEYCQSLGLPSRSTFADGAALLGGPWGLG
jgi:hypothetical protein